jgi:cytochrome P450
MDHDSKCPNYEGPCCPWMGECVCQCLCDFIFDIRKDEDQQILEKISKLHGKNRIWLIRSFKRREVYWNEAVDWVLRYITIELSERNKDTDTLSKKLMEELAYLRKDRERNSNWKFWKKI